MVRRLLVALGLAVLVARPRRRRRWTRSLRRTMTRKAACEAEGGAVGPDDRPRDSGPGIEAPIVFELKRPRSLRIDITVRG